MQEAKRDICIIGAGIIGTTIARRLSRYKLKITLIEKADDVAMGATKAANITVAAPTLGAFTARRIYIGAAAPQASDGAVGDLWIVI